MHLPLSWNLQVILCCSYLPVPHWSTAHKYSPVFPQFHFMFKYQCKQLIVIYMHVHYLVNAHPWLLNWLFSDCMHSSISVCDETKHVSSVISLTYNWEYQISGRSSLKPRIAHRNHTYNVICFLEWEIKRLIVSSVDNNTEE